MLFLDIEVKDQKQKVSVEIVKSFRFVISTSFNTTKKNIVVPYTQVNYYSPEIRLFFLHVVNDTWSKCYFLYSVLLFSVTMIVLSVFLDKFPCLLATFSDTMKELFIPVQLMYYFFTNSDDTLIRYKVISVLSPTFRDPSQDLQRSWKIFCLRILVVLLLPKLYFLKSNMISVSVRNFPRIVSRCHI